MGDALRLYHGSKSGIEGPIKPIGSSVNDFGRGFYLGDEPSQPLSLICRGERPTFYKCDLDTALVDCLKALNLGNQYCALTDAACARVKVVDSRVLSESECVTLREKSFRQRQRAIDEVERIRLRHLHDGFFFQEVLERDAKEGGHEA